VSGEESARIAGAKADLMIATEPKSELGERFDAAGGAGKPRIGQVAIAYDRDRDAAIARAHEQFRWFGLGWLVNTDLPTTAAFAAASEAVTPDLVAQQIACGPDVAAHVEKITDYMRAGFDEIALVQIGGEQQHGFIRWAETELLPELRRRDRRAA
jgi:G6PDH family F420-dependent oxidoreductase